MGHLLKNVLITQKKTSQKAANKDKKIAWDLHMNFLGVEFRRWYKIYEVQKKLFKKEKKSLPASSREFPHAIVHGIFVIFFFAYIHAYASNSFRYMS